MHDLSRNLRRLIQADHLSENELSRRTGVPQQVINRILNGQNENPKLATLSALATYFKTSISGLIGEDALGSSNSQPLATHKIPLLDWQEISDFSVHKKLTTRNREWLAFDASHSEQRFAVIMPDHSMAMEFAKGSILIFSTELSPKNADFIIFNTSENSKILFRQMLLRYKKAYMKSSELENDSNRPMLIEGNLQVFGVLIQTRQNYLRL